MAMRTPTDNIRYVLYARKSEEAEDRQIQSIDDQLNRLRELVLSRDLAVVRTFTEARSAKTPHRREEFEAMMRFIETGGADGIICWQINRLSRNPIESGRLAWLLQTGTIRSILTHDREYRPEDNALIFSVETGMANQFILELSRNIKRGLQGKLERGGLPGRAPLGYLNDRLEQTVIKDPDRFDLVRRAWELLLTGVYSIGDVARKLTEWGLILPVRRRSGGAPATEKTLYRLFRNPFYAGVIRRKGREYPGKHEPMITRDEFDRVQEVLGTSTHRPRKNYFTYSQLLRCGECSSMITAEIHSKYVKADKTHRTYRYYRCTWRGRLKGCTQRRYISEEALTRKIAEELERYTIADDARVYSLQLVKRHRDELTGTTSALRTSLEKGIEALKLKLRRLVQMFYSAHLSEPLFVEEKTALESALARYERQLGEAGDKAGTVESRTKEVLSLVVNLRNRFEKADREKRRVILSDVWSNRILKNGSLHFEPKPWLKPIRDYHVAKAAKRIPVEPDETRSETTQKGAFAPLVFSWSRVVVLVWNAIRDDEERIRSENNLNFPLPDQSIPA